MTPERYQKVSDIFADARELEPHLRGEFVANACGDDAELKAEVESLLAADEGSGDFIDSPALEVAAEMLADEKSRSRIGSEIGQYKIVSMLGTGGMGEVWLADDTKLKRRVALKLLGAPQKADFLLRFRQEAYAASALNHPNIITIFDIAEDHGAPFIATEFIDGETLRKVLHDGRLSIGRTVDIAVQVAAALSAAHAAGIVHRDIKPENVMVRNDGIVKILDFGLARFSENNPSTAESRLVTKPGLVMGTVTYMSPEQARALPIDGRTDIFSLGIVLFEMLEGCVPFSGNNDIETLAAILEREPAPINSACPESLRFLVGKMLNKDHLARPSAAEVFEELQQVRRKIEFSTEIINQKTGTSLQNEPTAEMSGYKDAKVLPVALSRTNRTTSFAVLAALVFLVFGSVAIWNFYFRSRAAVLTETDKIVLGEFENRTGDPDFDDALRQPLALSLAQSPFIMLLSDGQVRQTFKMMQAAPETRLTPDVAREVSVRRDAKAYLTAAIENYGVEYRLTLEVFASATGEKLASETVGAKNKDEVLPAIDKAALGIRERLGESLASLERFDVPINLVTTPSLEALKAYSLSNQKIAFGQPEEAIRLLNRAVEIDPNFASAWGSLAAAHYNQNEIAKAKRYVEKAFELRERTTEREKLRIANFYYGIVSGETDRDIDTLELYKQTYPRDVVPLVNLSETYSRLGRYAKAEENARAAINLDPTTLVAYMNLGQAVSRQNRFSEAKAIYEDARGRGLDNYQVYRGIYVTSAGLGDEPTMKQELEGLRKKDPYWAFAIEADSALFAGKFKEYSSLMKQSIEIAEKDEMHDLSADSAIQVAVSAAFFGKCAEAATWRERALKFERSQVILRDAAFSAGLCGSDTTSIIDELKKEYPKDTIVNSVWLPLTRAAENMRSAPDRALETLEINRQSQGGSGFWDTFLRGRIYLATGKPDLAVTEFQTIVSNRGWGVNSPLFVLAHRELARAYEAQNDTANAAKFKAIFEEMWKNADPDLLSVKDSPAS